MIFTKAGSIHRLILVLVALTAWGIAGCGGEEKALPESQTQQTNALVPDSVVENDDVSAMTPIEEIQTGESGSPEMAAEMETPLDTSGDETGNISSAVSQSASPPPGNAAGSGPFSLQLGSYTIVSHAQDVVSRLQDSGHPATVEEAEVGGVLYHRVFIRGLADRQSAEILGEDLHSSLGLSYLIRRK